MTASEISQAITELVSKPKDFDPRPTTATGGNQPPRTPTVFGANTTAQASALKTAGCERIFREKATGGRWNRPELQRLLDHLRKGDVLVVWKLNRLSRSLRDVLTIMERIQEAKAGFRSPEEFERDYFQRAVTEPLTTNEGRTKLLSNTSVR